MTYLNKVQNINKVNDEDFISMNREITEAELLTIVKSLPNNKTPGEDGLPSEFYKVFWQDIKYYLLESYKYSYQMGNPTITQIRGILCLTPKQSDPQKLENWRPLSLLNQDYKILSRLVAERVKIALPKIINHAQTGFLKGRYIGQNITTTMDLIYFMQYENIPSLVIAVDFEKAFDTLEWPFMYQCLEKFNSSSYIKQWVKILYTDIKSCVTNNGWSSEYFSLQRGVRQGCPLSPYMFILCAEIIAQ